MTDKGKGEQPEIARAACACPPLHRRRPFRPPQKGGIKERESTRKFPEPHAPVPPPIGAVRRSFAPWQDPAAVPLIRLDHVTKRFGQTVAVDDLTLDVFEREFFCLL